MINGYVYIDRKFRDEKEFTEMVEAAKAEEHGIFCPTHPLRKDDQVIGYVSVGSPGYPLTFAWLGECLQPRESFTIVNSIENLVALNGAKGICWPIPKTSPFHPLMKHLGYKNGGEYDFFYKML